MFHAFIPDRNVAIIGIEAGGRGPGLGENAASLSVSVDRACCKAALRYCCKMTTAKFMKPIRSRQVSTIRVSDPSTPYCIRRVACATESATDAEALAARRNARDSKVFCRHSKRRTHYTAQSAGPKIARVSDALLCMSGRGDKDMPTLQRTLLGSGA
jgi:tryptophan synthase beta subunit